MAENKWINAFLEAWELLTEIPVPAVLKENENSEIDNLYIISAFPWVGALTGILLFSAAYLCTIFIPVKSASALIGAITISLLSEIFIAGGNTFSLTGFIQAKKAGCSNFETAAVVESAANSSGQLNQIYIISIYLLKTAGFSLLIFYDRLHWIIIIYTLSFLIRSQLALWKDIRTGEPLFDSEHKDELIKYPWAAAAAISIFVAGFSLLPAAIAALLVSYFLLRFFDKFINERTGGVTSEIIAAAGTFSELVLLLTGILLIIRN